DPRGEVDRKTDIAAVAQSRLACIEPHAHPNQSLMRPHLPREHTLRLRRCRDSRSGTAKDREERVALPVDLDPSVLLEDRAKQLVVPAEQLAVALAAKLLEQPRRALDVREQEGDRAARKLGRGWHPAPSYGGLTKT